MTRKSTRPLALALVAVLAAGDACAEVSPWYLGAVASMQHDSNVYRVGDNQNLPAGYSASDTILTTSLIGGFDRPIGRQHAYGSVSLDRSRFGNNPALDNTGHALKLGLDWSTAQRLSGTISAGSARNLAQFNNRTAAGTIETARNMQTVNQLDAGVAWGAVTRWTLEGAAGLRRRSYSADVYRYLAYDERHLSAGTRYRASGTLTLGAAYRTTRVDYPNFLTLVTGDQIGSRIDRRDLDLSASWAASGASTVDLRLSPTRIHYVNALDDSHSDLTGAGVWTWQPTERTKIKATASRDTGQSAQAYNFGIFGAQVVDYASLTTALKLEASHELSGKTSLRASLTGAHRRLSDTVVFVGGAPTLVDGSDRTLTPALGFTWMPTRNAQVNCNFGRERRSAGSTLTVALSDTTYGCSGQLVLQ